MNCECGCPKSQHPSGACETESCQCDGYREPCPMCGASFRDHLGVVGMCRKYHGARIALQELLKAVDRAEGILIAEFGNRITEVNFGYLLDAAHSARNQLDG